MIDPAVFSELQRLCQRSFPERLDQRISRIEPLRDARYQGNTFSLSWRSGRKPEVERLVLRRYGDPWTWWRLEDTEKAQREWALMRWLYAEGLPVPRVYAAGSATDDDFVLRADASGHPLIAEGEEGSAQTHARVEALARLLARLHRLVPPDGERQVLPTVSPEGEVERLRAIADQCADAGLIEVLDELSTRKVEARPLCVLHGSPCSSSVLCDAQGVTALLNWENSALGDPRWDVARAASALHNQQATDLADQFCTFYEKDSGQSMADRDFWEALVAAQSWALATWGRTNSDPQEVAQSAGEALLEQQDSWSERAWRAVTRLRYEN